MKGFVSLRHGGVTMVVIKIRKSSPSDPTPLYYEGKQGERDCIRCCFIRDMPGKACSWLLSHRVNVTDCCTFNHYGETNITVDTMTRGGTIDHFSSPGVRPDLSFMNEISSDSSYMIFYIP
jgi:hypothetical protein